MRRTLECHGTFRVLRNKTMKNEDDYGSCNQGNPVHVTGLGFVGNLLVNLFQEIIDFNL